MNERDVLDLTVQTVDELELGLRSAISLALVEDFLRDLLFKNLGRLGLFQHLVLSEGQKALKDILRDRKANDELLPREERTVEESRKALRDQL